MASGAKLEICFLHAPLLHGEDTEMNLKTFHNSIFGYQNQQHVFFKDYGVDDALTRAHHIFRLNSVWNVSISFHMFNFSLEKPLNQIETGSI